MTTTNVEVGARYRHDEGEEVTVKEIVPLWLAENTWVNGVRYECAGRDAGAAVRPLSSFLERFTRVP